MDPHFLYRFLFANGLQDRPGHQTSTYLNSFAPGLSGDLGTHWTFDYTPTWTLYSNSDFSDSVDHSATIAGAYAMDNWSLKLNQSYVSSHATLIETAEQTHVQAYTSGIDLTHSLNDQISIEDAFGETTRRVEPPPNSYEWTNVDWLHYKFPTGLDTAIGVGVGYLELHPGANSEYIQPQARITYPVGTRLTLDVHGGDEDREFLGHGSRTMSTPIYGAAANYRPFDVTVVSVSGSRQVEPSFFANQITTSTDWSISLQQRLLGHFFFTAGLSYMQSVYETETVNIPVNRDDNARSFNLRLSTTLLGRGTVGVFYNRSQNSSNLSAFSFASSQVGVEVGFTY